MEVLLRSLLHDVRQRCASLRALLAQPLHPDVQPFAGTVGGALARIQGDTAALLADPSLGSPQLLANHFQLQKRLAEVVHLLESFPIPFAVRYGEADRFVTAICRRLCEQVGYPGTVPMVAAFSHEYYWTEAHFSLIWAPAAVDGFLLGLPDMCHELGHVLVQANEGLFTTDFLVDLEAHVRAERDRIAAEQRPPEYAEFYDGVHACWEGRWVREFLSDAVATFITGPAYGMQSIRLCTWLSRGIFGLELASGTHPSDESRTRGIAAMLELMAMGEEANRVRQAWAQYAALTGDQKEADYDLCYPDSLVSSAIRHAHSACRDLGLRPFTEQTPVSGAANLPLLMGEAWRVFLADPGGYAGWEQEQLMSLRQQLGLG